MPGRSSATQILPRTTRRPAETLVKLLPSDWSSSKRGPESRRGPGSSSSKISRSSHLHDFPSGVHGLRAAGSWIAINFYMTFSYFFAPFRYVFSGPSRGSDAPEPTQARGAWEASAVALAPPRPMRPHPRNRRPRPLKPSILVRFASFFIDVHRFSLDSP